MKRRGVVWRLLILAGWIAGNFLPMYSITRLSPGAREVFDSVFGTQEAIQLRVDEFFDVGVDLVGGALAIVVFLMLVRRRRPE